LYSAYSCSYHLNSFPTRRSSDLISLFFLELRYALLGSSLSKYIKDKSARFILIFSASMNDENYAVNYMKFATDKKWDPDDALLRSEEHTSELQSRFDLVWRLLLE